MEFLQALEPWMIPIVIMICVTAIVALSVVGNIIKASIERKGNSNISDNREFLAALRDFKEDMDRRVTNLERIAASEKSTPVHSGTTKENKRSTSQRSIELEMNDEASREEENNRSSSLKNMLNQ